MDKPYYPFEILDNAVRFEFFSVNNRRKIKKIVCFSETQYQGIYNLALLDVLDDGTESDLVKSNNRDLEKVLATVFQIMQSFFDSHPNCGIAFSGSTPERTRLYRIAIARELDKALELFNIWGISNGQLEPFEPNVEFEAFLFSLQ